MFMSKQLYLFILDKLDAVDYGQWMYNWARTQRLVATWIQNGEVGL